MARNLSDFIKTLFGGEIKDFENLLSFTTIRCSGAAGGTINY